eukprot:gene20719-biopygen21007
MSGALVKKSGATCFRYAMSIPNCVPQSPTWLVLRTSCPQNSRSLQMLSPMMVERRWPTCIFFAMFGDEKSTSTRCFWTTGGRTPSVTSFAIAFSTYGMPTEMLMKPCFVASAFEMTPCE